MPKKISAQNSQTQLQARLEVTHHRVDRGFYFCKNPPIAQSQYKRDTQIQMDDLKKCWLYLLLQSKIHLLFFDQMDCLSVSAE